VKKYQQAEERIREKHGLSPALSVADSRPWLAFRTVALPLLLIVVLEALSFLAVFHGRVNTVLCILFGLALFVLAMIRPIQALPVLAVEYLIGSKGALFNVLGDERNNGGLSLRIILFTAFFGGWIINCLRLQRWKEVRRMFEGRFEYLIFALLLVFAFVQGFLRHQPFLLADANAWGFWLLLLPVLDLMQRASKEDITRLGVWIAAGLLWTGIKTSLLFYLFSHSFPAWFLEPIYLWVRRTGVGEITRAGGNVFRIFFQSHIYALLLLPGLLLVQRFKKSRVALVLFGFSTLFLAQTLISLSRSLFLGLFVTGLVACVLAWQSGRIKAVLALGGRFIGVLLAASAFIATLCFFPLPFSSSSLLDAWQSRVNAQDDASASRWKLLPAMWSKIQESPILGSGFGATVTYTSRDPRVVQATGGVYTTYAFEWGWLEHWIKFGILGIPLLLFILIRIGRRIQLSDLSGDHKRILILSLIALAAVHVSTPYLNHPLGFAWLIGLEGMAEHWKRS
jgi:hypothetical protein